MTKTREKLLAEFYATHKEPIHETTGKNTREVDGVTYVVLDCPIEEFAKNNGLISSDDITWRK